MSNLPDTTTKAGQREASVMLAALMGELKQCICGKPGCAIGKSDDWFIPRVKNLYEPANMALAWRVLNWATTQSVTVKAQKGGGDDIWQEPWTTFIDDEINGKYEIYMMTPADAQRAWLDKILTLAIEAGMQPCPPQERQ